MEQERTRILLVEDNPGDARLLRVLLTEVGASRFELTHADTLGKGLECVTGQEFDVILLDLSLPDAQRLDTVNRMHAAASDKPIVVLTGLDDESVAVEAVRSGAQDYLVKGQIDGNLLARAIRYAIERKRTVTELEHARVKLEAQNQELAAASKLKSGLVDMAIHDFGTPMAIVRSYLELFRDGLLGELNEKQRDAVNRMLGSEDTLEGLRRDMLEISRFENGRIELEREKVDVREVAVYCVSQLEFLARGKGQEIVMNVPSIIARCDRRRISQVVTNYLSNAIRYTGENGRIEVSAANGTGTLRFAVKDSGRGIPEEDIERVFVGFYRSGEKVKGSTGLGLAVVKKIVEAHDGKAWCESEVGKGSTFHFSIPIDA